MRCLLQTIRRGEVSEARDIDDDCLTLGRGADQTIRLQSRLAGLCHAVIEHGPGRKLRIRAIAPNHILYNGRELTESVLMPGDEFCIGNVCFTVREAPQGYTLCLEVKEPVGRSSKELEDALLARYHPHAGLSGFSMRRAAWTMSLVILILFLLTPLAGFVYKPLGNWLRTLPLVSDLSWSSGPIDSAHSFFSSDCNRCHEQAFTPVQNSACTTCHKDTPHHVSEGFRETVDALESNRCASCHKEHNGADEMSLVRRDEALCTSCHIDIKAVVPDINLSDVSGFSDDHPEFKATIAVFSDGISKPVRIPLDQKDKLQERANLEFSHVVHLDKKGVKSPARGSVRLACADCHLPESGGKNMAKPDFETQCHECHRLKFETDDPKQELPHGDAKSVQEFLEGYYADRALKGGYDHLSAPQAVRNRHRPGEVLTSSESLEIREWAVKYARDVNAEVMRFRVCGKCHTVSQSDESFQGESQSRIWKIEPLSFGAHRFPKADFDHDKHKTQNCTDCHDAEKSEHSEDVLLKGIASCRECHGGAGAKNKVASTCIDCHGFHISQSLTMEGKQIEIPTKADADDVNSIKLFSERFDRIMTSQNKNKNLFLLIDPDGNFIPGVKGTRVFKSSSLFPKAGVSSTGDSSPRSAHP